jgi:phosphoribosylaminoimidazole-succinocarboxamide synthase
MNGTDGKSLRSLLDVGVAATYAGKVREMMDVGNRLMMVATDRISAFDSILPTTIPEKGKILTSISAFWLKGLSRILPTHFLSTDAGGLPESLRSIARKVEGRWMLVRKARPLPVECIVRGYLAGSGWREYEKTGSIGGQRLPAGLSPFGSTGRPVFTPSTKSHEGHDVNISPEKLRDLLGADVAARLESLSLEIFERGRRFAERCGLVLADTKFEFGWIDDRLALIDEVLTPDSSRYWPVETVGTGGPPKSLDKEFVRQYLKELPWNGEPPAPQLPPAVVEETLVRYREVERRLTRFSAEIPDLGDPISVP